MLSLRRPPYRSSLQLALPAVYTTNAFAAVTSVTIISCYVSCACVP